MKTWAQLKTEDAIKCIVITVLAARRARKLVTMSDWRKRNPSKKKQWDEENSDHTLTYRKNYNSIHRESRIAYTKRWRGYNISHRQSYNKKWELNNPDKARLIRKGVRSRRLEKYPHAALHKRVRTLIGFSIKSKNGRRTHSLIGCTPLFFSKWIESLFLPGMTFDNRAEWHLDHIFPVACCGLNEQQILRAQNYRNLRPMWKADNQTKSSKLTDESIVAGFLCGISEIHLQKRGQAAETLLTKAERLGFQVFRHFDENMATA